MKGVKFNKGDKIFAKVRGYPPWPAKIEAVADETPSKMKYHVYFFGTAETAIVKAEDICLYGPNRSKLGKRKKHKNFAEAMEEIEASLTPEERAAFDSIEDVDKLDESKESRLDESKVSVAETTLEDEDDDKSKKQKPKVPAKKDRKRKLDEEKPRETKRQKTEDAEDVKEEKVEPKQEVKEETEEKKEVLSRSGRKIKPKRYLDEEDEEKDTKDFIIAKKDGQIVKIPLNLNKPKIADRYESEWSQMVLEHATALKKQIENGEFKENVHSHMDEWTKAKSEEISAIENSESMRILDTEMDLLDNVNAIKKALTLDEAKCDKAISAFESLDRLSLTPLMLKKNPDTVYSIAKILNYKGNVKNWKLSEQELATFNENAEIIRKKAEHFYNKIIALFLVPGNQEFIIHFESEVASFNEKYAQLSAEEMVALTKEE